MSKLTVTVHNKESFDCKFTILSLMEPFHCKYDLLEIKASHFIRVPIEFRPRAVSEYTDEVVVRVDRNGGVFLRCKLKGRCVSKIN
jgi:hypothetical protein